MKSACLVAGSFDPVTLGHMDLIDGACALFDHVYAAVMDSAVKKYMFSASERTDMLKDACAGLQKVEVLRWNGLLTGLLATLDVRVVVRGLRDVRDYEAEKQIAHVNATLLPGTRTIWLSSTPGHECISSTIVRELIQFGGDISAFVPRAVVDAAATKYPRQAGGTTV